MFRQHFLDSAQAPALNGAVLGCFAGLLELAFFLGYHTFTGVPYGADGLIKIGFWVIVTFVTILSIHLYVRYRYVVYVSDLAPYGRSLEPYLLRIVDRRVVEFGKALWKGIGEIKYIDLSVDSSSKSLEITELASVSTQVKGKTQCNLVEILVFAPGLKETSISLPFGFVAQELYEKVVSQSYNKVGDFFGKLVGDVLQESKELSKTIVAQESSTALVRAEAIREGLVKMQGEGVFKWGLSNIKSIRLAPKVNSEFYEVTFNDGEPYLPD